jgi:hypothetical protein
MISTHKRLARAPLRRGLFLVTSHKLQQLASRAARLEEIAKFKTMFLDDVDKLIEMEHWLVDFVVGTAIAKANSTDSLQAELDRMKAAQQREQRRSNLPGVQCAAPGCVNMFRPRRRGHKTCSDACRQALVRSQRSQVSHEVTRSDVSSPDTQNANSRDGCGRRGRAQNANSRDLA